MMSSVMAFISPSMRIRLMHADYMITHPTRSLWYYPHYPAPTGWPYPPIHYTYHARRHEEIVEDSRQYEPYEQYPHTGPLQTSRVQRLKPTPRHKSACGRRRGNKKTLLTSIWASLNETERLEYVQKENAKRFRELFLGK